MGNHEIDILEIIKDIEEEKKSKNITPYHALFIPLESRALKQGMSHDQIADQLRDLYNKGKIRYERTINDRAIIKL